MDKHIPVLLKETIEFLSIKKGSTVLDATLGQGGHTSEIVKKLKEGILVGIDLDNEAIQTTKNIIPKTKVKLHIVKDNFRRIDKISNKLGIQKFDHIVLDLGWGSHQLKGKGFSFINDEPLNMCYGEKCSPNALDIINTFKEIELEEIIKTYGEERWAKRIAKFITKRRKEKYIITTKELSEIISQAVPRKLQPQNINISTKTFQALRIVVNDEIGALKEFLDKIVNLVNKEANVAIITFHSIEDRVVKQKFKDWDGKYGSIMNKKVIKPSEKEVENNKRSRSAKLRTFKFN